MADTHTRWDNIRLSPWNERNLQEGNPGEARFDRPTENHTQMDAKALSQLHLESCEISISDEHSKATADAFH